MNIEIQALNFSLSPQQVKFVERRMHVALDSSRDRIRRVDVWLSELPADVHDHDKRCLVHVELEGQTIIASESIDSDLDNTVHRAADQAGWRVPRCLGRQDRKATMSLPTPGTLTEKRLRSEYMLQ